MTAQFLFITAQIGYHCTLELGTLSFSDDVGRHDQRNVKNKSSS